jgi:hypothetical protein
LGKLEDLVGLLESKNNYLIETSVGIIINLFVYSENKTKISKIKNKIIQIIKNGNTSVEILNLLKFLHVENCENLFHT